MIVALTGVTGNMGFSVFKYIYGLEFVDKIRVLIFPTDKRLKAVEKFDKKMVKKLHLSCGKTEIVKGNLADEQTCIELVSGADYVINMAAVIPPLSDQRPDLAVECNFLGAKALVSAIEKQKSQPKFIHISTVALYGNRTSKHAFARVGDPLLTSPYDIYSATKLRGEFLVLESDIKKYVVLRQTAILHKNLISDNLKDGLLFHTCFNAPLEWITEKDTGILIRNILIRDFTDKDLDGVFWNKCFNIGGGEINRCTGYDIFDEGFRHLGGNTKKLFEPNYNATRNFHGVWFYDGDKLENLFHFQTQSTEQFWIEFIAKHKILKLAKIVPNALIKKFAIKRLFKDKNSAKYWINSGDEAKIAAYFKSREDYDKIPKDWKDFNLLVENVNEKGEPFEFKKMRKKENANLVNLFFDPEKPITIDDAKRVAEAHGGKCLSDKMDSIYQKLKWQNSDGEVFEARAHTVVACGHWKSRIYDENVWDFDRLAKKDKIYSQIWHDSHDLNENNLYYVDENFDAKIEKSGETEKIKKTQKV